VGGAGAGGGVWLRVGGGDAPPRGETGGVGRPMAGSRSSCEGRALAASMSQVTGGCAWEVVASRHEIEPQECANGQRTPEP